MGKQAYYNKYKRNKEAKKFYNSVAWKKVRTMALIRDNYLCQECMRKKKIKPADMVHHIKELEDYPDLGLVLENLESLCNPCHNGEHPDRGSKKDVKVNKKIRVVTSKANEEMW